MAQNTTLIAPKADFIAHLATIAGDGIKVVVDGAEYSIGADKVSGAIGELETVLDGLN